jgi:hypothetical protein
MPTDTIRTLFDPSRNIDRPIEKVITYGASQVERLKTEIAEYIVTESIEAELERLLGIIRDSIDAGGGHEVGVWVSGFYGSGKSSFTKYLGFAFDNSIVIDGRPFLNHFQDRLSRPQTRALLSALAARFPAAVVMLDLASEQLAGATMEEVSTVLYYKVLQFAGYSKNLKVAALERRLKKDGRHDELQAAFKSDVGAEWSEYKDDPLVLDSAIPRLAHKLYPQLFQSESAFSTATTDMVYLMNDRVQEMIDIVRDATGKDYVIFVVDEVGQYVGSQPAKILDLQGLAQNFKDLGRGKVWMMGTAQQTLTEDDPRAAINSPELYKLKDRFPISVDLVSSDIREICYRRLLAKSSMGEDALGELFDTHGQALRQSTKLVDAKYYDSSFGRDAFINLYPFLPAHFDILLHLLGALAKSTGGIGLRSAIKVVQDILIERGTTGHAVADRQVGWLATTVTLYDALERDIRRAFPSVSLAFDKLRTRHPDDTLCQDIGKTVAVLQILSNLPVTVENVAALMQPSVEASSLLDQVKVAVERLLRDPFVPLAESNGSLKFHSEKLTDVERERSQVAVRGADVRRIGNEALRDIFDPLPKVNLHGALSVTAGVKALIGGQQTSIEGERETVQLVVSFVDPADYDARRSELNTESVTRSAETTIFLLARRVPEADDLATEIGRSQRINEIYRNDPDQEVRDYCQGQVSRIDAYRRDIANLIRRSISEGSFIFRGSVTAVASLDQQPLEAARKLLSDVAGRVYDRFAEAAERVDTSLAEKFLRAPNLRAITSAIDPLGLVKIAGGNPQVRADHKAVVSIKDYIERGGAVEGKRILDHFSGPPFGWSQDTSRYILAAMLVGGIIKLKASGREITVNGQQAIEALKTNNTFRSVGVSLRDDGPSPETVMKAAERLTELSGEPIIPLEQEVGKAAQRLLPPLQTKLGPLEERLRSLKLPGTETVASALKQVEDVLLSDGSDAPQRFGAPDSALFESLKWAIAVQRAFESGLEPSVRSLRDLTSDISGLPSAGIPGQLRKDVADLLDKVTDVLKTSDFHTRAADLATMRGDLSARIADAARQLKAAQYERLRSAEGELKLLPEWSGLNIEEQAATLATIQKLQLNASEDMAGLKGLVARQFDIESELLDTKAKIVQEVQERKKPPSGGGGGVQEKPAAKKIAIPAHIRSLGELEALIARLEQVRDEIGLESFDLVIEGSAHGV